MFLKMRSLWPCPIMPGLPPRPFPLFYSHLDMGIGWRGGVEGGERPLGSVLLLGGKTDRIQLVLASCGIAAAVLETSIVLVLGLLRPGYDHLTQLISELGEVGAPNAIVMDVAGFFLYGLLLVVFAFGLHRGTGGLKVGPALVALGGIGPMGAAFFPCSPGCAFATSTSHYVASLPGLALSLAPFGFWWGLRKDAQWPKYGSYSLVTGTGAILILAVTASGAFGPWEGLGQRLLFAVLLLWIVIMAIHLIRLSVRTSPQPEGVRQP